MLKKNKKKSAAKGFNLIELMVAMLAASMLLFAIGMFMSNGQKTWNRLFVKVHGDTTVDGFSVHRVFQKICRKASVRKCVVGEDGKTLELYYWDKDSTAPVPENYAQFYLSDEALYVEHGKTQPGTWQPNPSLGTTTIQLASRVKTVAFQANGAAMHMHLTYLDENTMPVVCSSVRHNQ
jgi:prepilin-type N-terminal cleavage/methylation domain-containing protein